MAPCAWVARLQPTLAEIIQQNPNVRRPWVRSNRMKMMLSSLPLSCTLLRIVVARAAPMDAWLSGFAHTQAAWQIAEPPQILDASAQSAAQSRSALAPSGCRQAVGTPRGPNSTAPNCTRPLLQPFARRLRRHTGRSTRLLAPQNQRLSFGRNKGTALLQSTGMQNSPCLKELQCRFAGKAPGWF